MRKEELNIKTDDGYNLSAKIWSPDQKIIATLQITHGMSEHIARYEQFAKQLSDQGILVAGFDLRGHGNNKENNTIASMKEDGWKKSLEDIQQFSKILDEKYSDVPHYLLGFSLGSFLVREYMQEYDPSLNGVIIVGTAHQPSWILKIMKAIVKTQIKKAGFDNTTPLVEKLSFGTYNQKFKPNRTKSDWLCADEQQLDKYIKDSLSCENISSGLFYQLLDSMEKTGNKNVYQNWNKNIPIYLISGKDDPVGDGGKGVETVYQQMKDVGLRVEMKLLENARHDIFHEVKSGNAKQTCELITHWIKVHI